ncbi:MAG: transcriptional repressor [Oscillospiraceae bacterium]|nr:transcriptional repressor [Oscillospiraceae bacterium]
MSTSRHTIQRQIILDTLQSLDTHPSAEDLYGMIQQIHPTISKATVYRNLRQMADNGTIAQVAVTDGVARYDGCVMPHCHFICDTCNRVIDVETESTTEQHVARCVDLCEHRVRRHAVLLFGVCFDCDCEW